MLKRAVHALRIRVHEKDTAISQSFYTTLLLPSIHHSHEIAIYLLSLSTRIMHSTFVGRTLPFQVRVAVYVHRAMLGALILADKVVR